MSRFPENVIVQATTHGGISIQNGKHKTFKLPEGMTVAKLSAVSPGICNLMTSEISNFFSQTLLFDPIKEDIIKFLNFLKRLIDKFGEEKVKEMFLENGYPPFIKGLIGVFKEKDKANITDIESKMDIADQEELDYYNNFDNSYFFTVNREIMLNRIYQRSPQEYFGDGTSSGTWDFKVSVLNVDGQPDLIQEIDGRTTHRIQLITSKQIMQYLYDNGARNVFFADFTCFSFLIRPKGTEISQEDAAALTKYLIENHLLGGKKSRRRKRRHNKRRKTRAIKNRKTRNRK